MNRIPLTEAWLLTLCLCGSAWLIAFFYVPRIAVSRYRYRLWAIRDCMMLDIFEGTLPRDQAVQQRLSQIETDIRVAGRVTTSSLIAHKLVFRGKPANAQPQSLRTKVGSPTESPKLRRYDKAVERAVQEYLLLRSYLGWLLIIPLALAGLVQDFVGFLGGIGLPEGSKLLVQRKIDRARDQQLLFWAHIVHEGALSVVYGIRPLMNDATMSEVARMKLAEDEDEASRLSEFVG